MMKNKFIAFVCIVCLVVSYSCAQYEVSERPSYSLYEEIYVDKLEDSDYQLELRGKGSWKIFSGPSLAQIDWTVGHDLSTSKPELLVLNAENQPRLYFAAVQNEDTLWLSEREIDLEEAYNFRDLGGISTSDGRQVRWGMLYRSGEIHDVSDDELELMSDLGLKTIVDLRSNEEIEDKPDRYPATVEWIHLPIGNLDGKTSDFMKSLKDADPETFDGEGLMEEMSAEFINSVDEYRNFFQLLLQDNKTPLLFHCTAGKDRTGYTSALLLAALGVKEEVIIDEYLLSNYFRYEGNEEMIEKAAKFYGIDHRVLRSLMVVQPSYLESGLQKIKSEYGSIDQYLEGALAVDSLMREELKSKFLY